MPRNPTPPLPNAGLKKRTKLIRYQAIFFDFDGVLVESVEIKTGAFKILYQDEDENILQSILAHHLDHEGISRVEKIRHYHKTFLNIDLGEDELAVLAGRFSMLVKDAVINCDSVAGAMEFLETHAGNLPIFVVSGTPEDEMLDVVEQRGMSRYFTSVHGSPRRKTPIVTDLLKKHGLKGPDCLFVGDAMTDYGAAMDTGLQFIGRVAGDSQNPFPPGTTIIRDLRELTV